MNRQKAIKEYLTSQSLVGKNYENSTIEMIIKKGLKYEISIFQNEELVKNLLSNEVKEEFFSQEAVLLCDILEALKDCEESAQMSKE